MKGKTLRPAATTMPLSAHRVAPGGSVRGGIVMLPGLRESDATVMELARRFARERYVVLVPELVAGLGLDPQAAARAEQAWQDADLADDPTVGDVMAVMQSPDYERWVMKALRATVAELAKEPGVDTRIAVIGYGTGGGLAFALAAVDSRVRLALSYDCVATDIDLVENIKGAAVSFYAADNAAAAEGLPELRAAMRRAGVPFCAKKYPGNLNTLRDLAAAGPQSALARDLWQRSLAMLRLHLA